MTTKNVVVAFLLLIFVVNFPWLTIGLVGLGVFALAPSLKKAWKASQGGSSRSRAKRKKNA